MTGKDKVGADAGLEVNVTVHDYDPVRPAPPKPRRSKAKDEPVDNEVDG